MNICSTTESAKTGGRTIGTRVLFDASRPIDYGIRATVDKIPIGTVVCFDNESSKKTLLKQIATGDLSYGVKRFADDYMPRIGVVTGKDGQVKPIHLGDASVLKADDLECVSLLSAAENLYVATSSLGRVHVFKISVSLAGCFSSGFLTADHVAEGQLPIPANESHIRGSINQTKIEATAVFLEPTTGLYKFFWAGRGGERTGRSWTKMGVFNPKIASIDMAQPIEEGYMASITGLPKWRTCSCLVIEVEGSATHFYFASVYDGTEDGYELDLKTDQTSVTNKKAFKSVIAQTTYRPGVPATTSIIGRYEGIKVEALMKVENTMGKVTHLVMGTDDEALGSLLGVVDLKHVADTTFVDLGKINEEKTFITRNKWGTSGMAPAGAFAFELFGLGSA
jgi:hypothetical protein